MVFWVVTPHTRLHDIYNAEDHNMNLHCMKSFSAHRGLIKSTDFENLTLHVTDAVIVNYISTYLSTHMPTTAHDYIIII